MAEGKTEGVEVAEGAGVGVALGTAGAGVAAGTDGGLETWPVPAGVCAVPDEPAVLVEPAGPLTDAETVSVLTGVVETRLTLMEFEEDGEEATAVQEVVEGPETVPREYGSAPLERVQPEGSEMSAVTPEKVPVGDNESVSVTDWPAETEDALEESDAAQEGISLTTMVLEAVEVAGDSEPSVAVIVNGEA